MGYEIQISRSAQKELAKINSTDQPKLISAIKQLAHEPRPKGTLKLKGRDAWRIRIQNYRIIYEIFDQNQIVKIITLGHRRYIYR